MNREYLYFFGVNEASGVTSLHRVIGSAIDSAGPRRTKILLKRVTNNIRGRIVIVNLGAKKMLVDGK